MAEQTDDAWREVSEPPRKDGPYLVYLPRRTLDRFSVQHWDHRDGWSNDYGITHWRPLPPAPEKAVG